MIMLRIANVAEPSISGMLHSPGPVLWLRGLWSSAPRQVPWTGETGVAGQASTTQQQEGREGREEQMDEDEDTSYTSGPEAQRRLVKQIARQSLAAEVSAAAFFKMQARCSLSGPRIDLDYFRDQELQLLQRAKESLLLNKARPSALQGLLGAAGLALGTLAGVAPRRVNLAISGALQDALTDHFTDQIRRLHASGAGAEGSKVRELLRGLRDAERAPDGAPRAPDLLALSKMRSISDLGVEGAVGAVVKAGALAALNLASKL